jgi:hypothetical protein
MNPGLKTDSRTPSPGHVSRGGAQVAAEPDWPPEFHERANALAKIRGTVAG